MRPRQRGMGNLTAGVIGLVVVVVACYFGFTKANPFASHFELRAAFKSSNNIRPGSPVRIAGVTVGKVASIEGDGEKGSIVKLRINEKGLPVHADAHAAIRPRIFLEGNFFVDLQAGTPSAPVLGDGDVLPVNQTSTPVQLDQILTALQSNTREDLQVVLKEYASALKGRGAQGYRDSLKYWEPAYRDSAIVADASLGEVEHDLSEYIRGAEQVARALDRSPEALKSLITDFNTTAGAFARSEGALRAAVGELPRTLRAAQPALARLNESFPPLRALVRDLRPGVRNSLPAILASTPLVTQLRGLVSEGELRGLVSDLRPTVPSLTRLTKATVPLYRQTRLASSCQNEVILPWTKDTLPDPNFPAKGKVFEEAVKPLPGLSGESRSGDANGQWFRVLVSGGTNLVQFKPGVFAATDLAFEGTNPPRPDERPRLSRSVPCETQEPPNLATEVGAAPEQSRVDTTTPEYRARYAQAKEKAVKWLTRQLKLDGLDSTLKVVTDDVSADLLDRMARLRGTKVAP